MKSISTLQKHVEVLGSLDEISWTKLGNLTKVNVSKRRELVKNGDQSGHFVHDLRKIPVEKPTIIRDQNDLFEGCPVGGMVGNLKEMLF